ncbi:MAG: tetratricopeptide repeat protein [Proteobacteria bacterium]|nr:tetratricopeptide repeat protein [Pseudomonadota bacterium]
MKKFSTIVFFLLFLFNTSLKADYLSYLTEQADKGDIVSQNNLGHLYLDGSIEYEITKDTDKAIYYLSAAAAQGQVNAMTTVGWVYFTGEHGAPKDNEEAIYWNQKASDSGFTVASYNLGFFYYSGLAGLEQDLTMAKKYWLLSASQWLNSEGSHDLTAEELLDEINEYNPSPTKEMIKLRDLFIKLLKSNPS